MKQGTAPAVAVMRQSVARAGGVKEAHTPLARIGQMRMAGRIKHEIGPDRAGEPVHGGGGEGNRRDLSGSVGAVRGDVERHCLDNGATRQRRENIGGKIVRPRRKEGPLAVPEQHDRRARIDGPEPADRPTQGSGGNADFRMPAGGQEPRRLVVRTGFQTGGGRSGAGGKDEKKREGAQPAWRARDQRMIPVWPIL